ncbi:MAG: PQQ-dependent sugar dehydrogenase [Pseudomonadota bacterium]
MVGVLDVEVLASGLSFPWSLVVLPDDDFLVTEKAPGRLRRVARDGVLGPPLTGLPSIYVAENGGLLGLALDPDYADNRRVYFAFSEPGDGEKAGLSVGRGTLGPRRLANVETIFRQQPKVADARNFGGRLTFAPDGTLFVLTGDRFAHDLVQPRDNTIGVVARIHTDGTIPANNPFVGQQGIDPAIWSSGHRNLGGGAFHPETGRLWVVEFGPWGGDELNIAEPARNFGWPLVSWGQDYSGKLIPDPPTQPHLTPSIFHWHPVFGPSGLVFYDGELIPRWSGDLLVGGLTAQRLTRLTLRGERVIAQEDMLLNERIRDVVIDRDGAVLLLTDGPDGKILRLAPSSE